MKTILRGARVFVHLGDVLYHAEYGKAQRFRKQFPAARNLVLKATVDDAGEEGDAQQEAADMARNAIDAARRTHAQGTTIRRD